MHPKTLYGLADFEAMASEVVDVSEWDTDEVVNLWAQLDAFTDLLSKLRKDLRAALVETVDRKYVAANGLVVRPRPSTRVALSTTELTEWLLTKAARWFVDPETGDRIRAVDVDRLALGWRPNSGAPARLSREFEVPTEQVAEIEVIR